MIWCNYAHKKFYGVFCWRDPNITSWYCCDPSQKRVLRDPNAINVVLLWSSSEIISERSQYHQNGIAVILLKDIFEDISMPSSWYCCDPPQRFLWRYPNVIIKVLLWSSSKTSLEISQCHYHGIPVMLLNDFLVKKQDWFVSNPASWQRNPWGRS